MPNTIAVQEEETVQLNLHGHYDDDDDNNGRTAVVMLLDQTFSSPQLKSALENQTKLHMDWYNKMVSFYTHKAIIIPLEYCVSPSRADLPAESVHESYFGDVFFFRHGDNLRRAMKHEENYVSFRPLRKKEEENTLPLVDTTTIDEASSKLNGEDFSVKRRHKDIEELNSLDVPPLHLRNNREFMMKQVEQNGLYLYYAHPDLLKDEELLLTAIKNNYSSFLYAPWIFRNRDENFVRKALEANGGVFIFLKHELRSRQDFFELSLKTSGEGFSSAVDRLITAEAAEKAMSYNWKAIKYIKPDKPFYTKLVEIVLKQNIPDDELIGSNLISDTQLIIKMLDISYKAFFVATKTSTLDEEIIVKALNKKLLLANYMTVDHFKLILGHVDLINKLIQRPDIDMNQLARCMGDYEGNYDEDHPHIDIIRLIICKRPNLVKYFYKFGHKKSIDEECLNPFILRSFDIDIQLKILRNLSYSHSIKKEDLQRLGYELSTYNYDNTLYRLKERFSKSHPGLVIPYHRFGYSFDKGLVFDWSSDYSDYESTPHLLFDLSSDSEYSEDSDSEFNLSDIHTLYQEIP